MELSTQAAAMKQEKQQLLARLDTVIMSLQEYQNAVRFYENQVGPHSIMPTTVSYSDRHVCHFARSVIT